MWQRSAALIVGLSVLMMACDDPPRSQPSAAVTDRSVATTPTAIATTPASPSPTPAALAAPQDTTTIRERDMELIAAAGRGDLAAVRRLLAQGAGVHARDHRGRTALIAAAYGDQIAVAEALIAAGADVNVKDDTQQSAYLIPTADGSLALLRLMLRSGADVQSTDSYNGTGLIRAADRGHVEIIRELLTTAITVDHVNRLGWTALLEAIILGNGGPRHTEVVRLLAAAGADVNLADSQGVTPLAHAERRDFGEIVAILRGAGAR